MQNEATTPENAPDLGGQVDPLVMLPPVLDACCGSRSFWFDKQDSRAVFVDKRMETIERKHNDYPRAPIVVDPDKIGDFTNLEFPDESFNLVVFDPPHIEGKQSGNVLSYYGALGPDWRDEIKAGFAECFRVLKPNGVLVFKWNETQIKVREVLELAPMPPLFGHKSGKLNKTHWLCFMKA